ncbi:MULTISPECIES: hypothetical protein [Nocardioides]|uniref:Excreted virulence factor EspC, type VII ESX diderm n=1 Tax=Nocardioides lianchengensis TaxID=1045774 RepID=A0A1G6LGW2_9ACTN|nr:hypothetical protein [Nocardioides lianchengensis]NYG12573.1 hypothetical protein [Nocardioides lianchengensis]SDC41995.1 hypothetical protein SAMN05421872_102228 [Nocardioides lianchengensis]
MLAAVDILRGVGVDEALLAKIERMLEVDSTKLSRQQPVNASAGKFGGSGAGANLDHHASTAHQHVVEALNEMVAGLQNFHLGVRDFGRFVVDADDTAQVDTTRIQQRTDAALDCAGGTDFRNQQPTTCAAPSPEDLAGSDDEGDS